MRNILASWSWLLLCAAPAALALDHVWIIGGGPRPSNSQAQIEFNVSWVIQALNNSPGARQLHVYYTDGTGHGRDVVLWQSPRESKETLQPLARVFARRGANGDQFYSHRVTQVLGSTEAGTLRANLEREFSELRSGDRALLIYNGHGSRNRNDPARNSLDLWNDTSLSVRDMDQIMSRINPGVPVRFVFTQCYSGGFSRLIHPQARDTLALGEANRCGFFAESEDREAEGCAASINIGDYRDYSTYFFAALYGRTRLNEEITVNPDRDGDGVISLFEAHLFVLSQAHNSDLPRSTSEVFLERWQPWYLRWINTGAEPDNVYTRLAREVAKQNGLPESAPALAGELRTRRKALAGKMLELEKSKGSLIQEISQLQEEIRKEVGLLWPESLSPYTLNFVQFLKKDLDAAQEFILSHPSYAGLVAVQDRYAALMEEMTGIDRDITQLDKVLRLRNLARLLSQLERHGTEQERGWYQRLQSCENQPL
ncbi:MAG: hypothetical protein OEM83_04560 [Gammaproteobacteria bacterium]|nr:hypothetical protein [Gammaproteobacteria bacterium]